MSYDVPKYSLEPTTRKLIAAACAVCINVILFLMIDALFMIDSSVAGGRLLS